MEKTKYYISSGRQTKMFTLRYNAKVWCGGSKMMVWKSYHDTNLSTDWETAVAKAKSLIGEDGVRLSGGEKQRISIARAMLKKTPIILLDEATSSLDSETEEKIQNALNILIKDKTTIVIAHRLSTILNSDKIFVVEKGEILTSGKHEELIKNSDQYRSFYEKQVRKE